MSQLPVRQIWALVRRYLSTVLRKPVRSFIRAILWPSFVIGTCIYLLVSQQDQGGDIGMGGFEKSVPVIVFLTTAFQVYHFSEWLVMDKATGIKSLMTSMGLKRISYYIGNALCFIAFVLPFMVAAAITSSVFLFQETKSSVFAISLVYILFVLHLAGTVFAVTSFITSTSFVATVFVLLLLENGMHPGLLWLAAKASPSLQPFVLFLGSVSPYESLRLVSAGYLSCKNCETTTVDGTSVNQPVYLILIAMTFWTMVAFAFASWFDEVCPWQTHSAPKSPLFCFKSTTPRCNFIELDDESTNRESEYFERCFEAGREIGIRINKVTKKFRGVPVVDNVTFSIYKGETTLLLGHNGAGKTTLMSIILGKLNPEQGGVLVQRDDRNGLSVGVCPQHSILDENLNVKQHLELFADIKSPGMSRPQLKQHITTTIDDVSLTDHVEKIPSELSGGMKRKLSLAIAFVGESSILILDEPSSGLDPDSRVFIWNAIRRYRTNRTVLLSTQHMEEADYLGDRIAIMNAGQIVCCGSSTYLNGVFGSGYKLRVECLASKRKQVLAFVQSYFENAKLSENDQIAVPVNSSSPDPVHGMVIELSAEQAEDYESKLINMLTEIETRSSELHIISHGLKSSSIEDVMLHTSKSFGVSETSESVQLTLTSTSEHIGTLANPLRANVSELASQRLFLYALIVKHLQSYKKDLKLIVFYRLLVAASCVYFLVDKLEQMSFIIYYSSNLFNTVMIFHFIYYPTLEQVSKFKIMQLTSNVSFVIYWLAQLLTDMITIVVLVISANIMLPIFFTGEYLVSQFLVHLIVTLSITLFGISAALLAYNLSTVMSDAKNSMGYHLLFYCLPFFASIIVTLSGLTLQEDLRWLQVKSDHLFAMMLPTDALQFLFYGLASKCYLKNKYYKVCEEAEGFSPVIFGLLSLCGQIVVYASVLYLIESKNINLSWYLNMRNIIPRRNLLVADEREVDSDVVDETTKAQQVIGNVPKETYSLVAADINKSYIKGVKVIDHLSFTVNRGECFGLLGVNGAGKSTTFSMITAENRPDSGQIWMGGYYMDKNVDKYRHNLGYDPQSNPEMSLSAMDALYLMARLRLVNEQSIPMLVQSVLELLNLSGEHASKSAKDLSGGMKRKLALGMSLMGNPSVLALDEPTAGIDPMARRDVWQLLRSLRMQNGASIIISSHAMEECEAICDRISIMARGRLRCIGTFLHLRSKFSQGCSVKVQFVNGRRGNVADSGSGSGSGSGNGTDSASLANKVIVELNQRLASEFGQSVRLADTNINSATFDISDKAVKRSSLFMILREFKQRYPNMSYMINDSSLEDIFIALAREQQQIEQAAKEGRSKRAK